MAIYLWSISLLNVKKLKYITIKLKYIGTKLKYIDIKLKYIAIQIKIHT